MTPKMYIAFGIVIGLLGYSISISSATAARLASEHEDHVKDQKAQDLFNIVVAKAQLGQNLSKADDEALERLIQRAARQIKD